MFMQLLSPQVNARILIKQCTDVPVFALISSISSQYYTTQGNCSFPHLHIALA